MWIWSKQPAAVQTEQNGDDLRDFECNMVVGGRQVSTVTISQSNNSNFVF